MRLLEIKGLTARYNAGEVPKGLDLVVESGEIVALLGSNGAGTSTTLRAITGLVPHVAGEVTFAGTSILGLRSLLDEPSLGLAPMIVQQVFRILRQIRERGTTVLLVEQNANVAPSAADRGYVLKAGSLLVSGTPDALWNDP
jgi:ABC-type branched-subunit amino acid transport system ATPase component